MFQNFNKSETQLKGASFSQSIAPPSIGFPQSDRNMSVVGQDLTINGDLISKGELRVDGVVQGDIKGTRVVIGEHARITGDVLAEAVAILGHVLGSVRGLRVSLHSTSHVEGDVDYRAFVMEQGAFFEGRSRHSDDPLADPPASELTALNASGEG